MFRKIKLNTIVTILQVIFSLYVVYYIETFGIGKSILAMILLWGLFPALISAYIHRDIVIPMYLNIVDMTYEVIFGGKGNTKEKSKRIVGKGGKSKETQRVSCKKGKKRKALGSKEPEKVHKVLE